MSSAVFRQIAEGRGPGKAEKLFRAAISAFCSLARPTRNEVAQLDGLALPLFDSVSVEGRRFAAAALSECETVPPGLIRRLADQPVDIAAPLLIRSPGLRDIDLIALIGRHGLPHAAAIGRRPNLNPAIADLVGALLAQAKPEPTPQSRTAESEIRARLRGMMGAATPLRSKQATTAWNHEADAYDKLRSTALTGVPELLQRTLADILAIDISQARRMTESTSYGTFIVALKALALSPEQAFVVTAAVFPRQFGHAEAVRLFLERFAGIEPATARETLRGWKSDASASVTDAHNVNGRRRSSTLKA